jgi:hypothetical protein
MNSAAVSRITQISAPFGFNSQLAPVIEGQLNMSSAIPNFLSVRLGINRLSAKL